MNDSEIINLITELQEQVLKVEAFQKFFLGECILDNTEDYIDCKVYKVTLHNSETVPVIVPNNGIPYIEF